MKIHKILAFLSVTIFSSVGAQTSTNQKAIAMERAACSGVLQQFAHGWKKTNGPGKVVDDLERDGAVLYDLTKNILPNQEFRSIAGQAMRNFAELTGSGNPNGEADALGQVLKCRKMAR